MGWESCGGRCVPLLPPGCSAQPGRGPGGVRALRMAQVLAENRVPRWCPEPGRLDLPRGI